MIKEASGHQLAEMIARYPDILVNALNNLEPCVITTYAFQLSHAISVAVETMWVMNQPPEIAAARLRLYWAARVVLGGCMRTVGLIPLERM